jgi:hypothetical protein
VADHRKIAFNLDRRRILDDLALRPFAAIGVSVVAVGDPDEVPDDCDGLEKFGLVASLV